MCENPKQLNTKYQPQLTNSTTCISETGKAIFKLLAPQHGWETAGSATYLEPNTLTRVPGVHWSSSPAAWEMLFSLMLSQA